MAGKWKDAARIFHSALAAVSPSALVRTALAREGDVLIVNGTDRLPLRRNVRVVAFGKAVLGMVTAVDALLRDHIVEGHASIPVGLLDTVRQAQPELLPPPDCKVQLHEGAVHNLPDMAAMAAAEHILRLAKGSGEDDIVLVLISGGGSALLPLPVEGISLEEKQRAVKILGDHGATIQQLNVIRKHVSQVKGGRLAEACFPSRVVSLVISDVVGDPLDIIASGPCVPDESSFQTCQEIIDELDVRNILPPAVIAHLNKGARGEISENPSRESACFANVTTLLVGSNKRALEAAREAAVQLGYATQIVTDELQGAAREAAYAIVRKARSLPAGKHCLLYGGETTVLVRGTGKGGRNQELALIAAIGIQGSDTVILSAGTDGQDGPTPAAGAFADGQTVQRGAEKGLDVDEYLGRNDSFSYFEQTDGAFITGLTETNVMDIQVVLVDRGTIVEK